jgi:AraC family transcriptional regulator
MSVSALRGEVLTAQPGLSVTRWVCSAGPRDRPFPEEHRAATLAVVLGGSFCYRCRGRTHALVPGAVMLGEPGEPFVCSHEHGVGDVCLSVGLSEGLLESAASVCAAPGRLFAASVAPPRARVVAVARALEQAARAGEGGADELALALAGEVFAALAGQAPRAAEPSPADRARAVAAAQIVGARADGELPLAELAREVGLSAYHFLRVFRRVFGVTPHQYLVQTRVERAAARLLSSDVPVTALAFEVGFGDLSNFVNTFRRLVGTSPGEYRRSRGRSKNLQVAGRGGR